MEQRKTYAQILACGGSLFIGFVPALEKHLFCMSLIGWQTGAHRIPVTLNFDSGSGQYWGTYINEYYGDYHLGERNGHPTIYFDTINATRLNRPARLLNPEKAYFDFLYGEKMLSSDGDELVIRNFRGDYIRFKAVN